MKTNIKSIVSISLILFLFAGVLHLAVSAAMLSGENEVSVKVTPEKPQKNGVSIKKHPGKSQKTSSKWTVWSRKDKNHPWEVVGDYDTKEEAYKAARDLSKQGKQPHVQGPNEAPPKP